jgi:hypothetical protein
MHELQNWNAVLYVLKLTFVRAALISKTDFKNVKSIYNHPVHQQISC